MERLDANGRFGLRIDRGLMECGRKQRNGFECPGFGSFEQKRRQRNYALGVEYRSGRNDFAVILIWVFRPL